PFKFVVKDSITTFMLFLVRIAIIALTAVIAYFLIDYDSIVTRYFYQDRMATYSLIPIAFLILISYLIASAFVSVYSMAIDTIFICLLEDRGSDVGKT
ncbi:hypothetical protein, partial [Salmonella sp. s51228]|uniref:hypothetical protein n=1 Tax=Salmonella sp. s51228 TaxID=3159652 RepID=UPI00397E970F